jgi:hypothetical protein
MNFSNMDPRPGVYARTISDLSKNGYANLKYLDEFMKKDYKAKYTVLNFPPSFESEPVHEPAQRKASREMLGRCRSLYIVEDLSGDVIEELGLAFEIEPQFFAEHLRDVEWEHHKDKSNTMMLPSVRHFANYWTLPYLEPIEMNGQQKSGRRTMLDMNVLRRMDFRSPHKDRKDIENSVGLVHRVLSFWHRRHNDGQFFEGMVSLLFGAPSCPGAFLRLAANTDTYSHSLGGSST